METTATRTQDRTTELELYRLELLDRWELEPNYRARIA
jgi:hypothetical protein